MIRLKSLLTEDTEPTKFKIHGNTARLIDLTSTRKGLAIYKKLDIDRVKYYQGGRVLDPETGETIVTAQRNLTDDQVIDFLYKNRNSAGGYRGIQNNLKENESPNLYDMGRMLLDLADANADILNEYPKVKQKLMTIVNMPDYIADRDKFMSQQEMGYEGIPEYVGYEDAVAIYNYTMNFYKKQK